MGRNVGTDMEGKDMEDMVTEDMGMDRIEQHK